MEQKLVRFSDFARELKCTPAAVSLMIKDGRIADAVVEVKGRRFLDLEKARYLYLNNTRPHPNNNHVEQPKTPNELRKTVNELPEDDIPDLNVSRARAEHYKAELAKLQLLEARKGVVAADDVKKEAFETARVIREALMNLADRLSHQLAGEEDTRLIHKMLTDEHRQALEELSKYE